jgi:hypothetical protein
MRYELDADSLSFLSLWLQTTGTTPPLWIRAVPALLFAVAVPLRGSRTPAGFAAGAALIAIVIFASLSDIAHANYYYFTLGALWVAVAVAEPLRDRSSDPG